MVGLSSSGIFRSCSKENEPMFILVRSKRSSRFPTRIFYDGFLHRRRRNVLRVGHLLPDFSPPEIDLDEFDNESVIIANKFAIHKRFPKKTRKKTASFQEVGSSQTEGGTHE